MEVISLSGSPLAKASPPSGSCRDSSRRDRHKEAGADSAGGADGAAPEGRESGAEPEGLAGILDVVGRALEPVYGFRSLATFKSRFKPEYRTLYLYYQDPLQLPAMGRALSRAYLPGLSVRQSARLLADLVR